MANIDEIDKKLLRHLARNARLSNQQLADLVGLSPSPCARRIKRLEDNGLISAYRAQLNAQKLGYGLSVFVAVTMERHTPDCFRVFEEAVCAFPEVVRVSMVTGRAEDYILQVKVANLQDYEAFLLGKLNQVAGVANVHSSFEMRAVLDREVEL